MPRYALRSAAVLLALAVGCDCCDPTQTVCKDPDDGDTASPSVPSGIGVTPTSHDRIHVGWSPASDDRGVAGYRVYRGSVAVHDTTETSYEDVSLTPSTRYCYALSAFDAAGNESARSPESCATTWTRASVHVLSVTVAGNATGAVTSSPAGITCGADCSEPFAGGTTVTLTAVPDPSPIAVTTTWSGCDSATPTTCSVSMVRERSVTASFDSDSTPRYELGALPATSSTGSYTVNWSCVSAICSTTTNLQEAPDTSFGSPKVYTLEGNVRTKSFAGKAPGKYCYRVAAAFETNWSAPKCITVASSCTPSCESKTCGPDGCGGSCGTCPLNSTCNAFGTDCTCNAGYVPDPSFTKCIQLGGACVGTGVDPYGYCADRSTWVWCDPRHGITWMSCPDVTGTQCYKASSSGTWGACGCGAIDGTNGTCGSGGSAWSANELHYVCSYAGILYATNCKARTGRSTGLCSTLVNAFGWQTACFCDRCLALNYSTGACYAAGSGCSYDSAANVCSCP